MAELDVIGADRTQQKALQINLDTHKYGTFAEIGAGQEVARYFFQAGGASGTVAKTMSAYDMVFSDAIYGRETSGRYVCESRLKKMIDKEFGLLNKRLGDKRDADTQFFAFANTVATINFTGTNDPHGWIGFRFFHKGKGHSAYSDVILHVRMLDRRGVLQQQSLGVIGVNLIHASFYCAQSEEEFVTSLMEDLGNERLEIDTIRVAGPAFEKLDNRILALQLVREGVTHAVMFDPDGNVIQPSEVLYKRHVLALRGSFRPPTHVNMDMLEMGLEQFGSEEEVDPEKITVLTEITLTNLTSEGQLDLADFFARVDLLGALGQNVLISNYQEYFKLVAYFSRYTKKRMGLVLGVFNLQEVFNPKYYEGLPGGILEALGGLFNGPVRMYVYPAKNRDGSGYLTCENLPIEGPLGLIFGYFLKKNCIVDLKAFNPDILDIYSRKILKMITLGESEWENMLPPVVAETVKKKELFGYKNPKKTSSNP